jgi:hypothetical protein
MWADATLRALETIVLYEKICIPPDEWYHAYDLTRLQQAIDLEVIHEEFPSYMSALFPLEDRNDDFHQNIRLTLQYIRPLLQPFLFQVLEAFGVFDRLKEACRQFHMVFDDKMTHRFVSRFIDLISVGMRLDDFDYKDDVVDRNLRAWVIAAMQDDLYGLALYSHEAAIFCYVFDQASLRDLAIVSSIVSKVPQIEHEREEGVSLPNRLSQEAAIESFRLFRVTLNKLDWYFPEVNSIPEALRLREDKRISRFRKRIMEFSKGLKSGDSQNLEDMQRAVADSSKALRGLQKANMATRWATYVSLPVTVAESLFSLLILGPCIAVIGTGAQAVFDYTAIKHDWILFGSERNIG